MPSRTYPVRLESRPDERLGAGLLGVGLVSIAGGAWLQVAGLRSRRTRPEEELVPIDAPRR
jgi:hypothetical protein